jgi:hypothetical protein
MDGAAGTRHHGALLEWIEGHRVDQRRRPLQFDENGGMSEQVTRTSLHRWRAMAAVEGSQTTLVTRAVRSGVADGRQFRSEVPMAGFVEVAKVAELAEGTARVIDVSGHRVALVNVGGSLFAVDNESDRA